MSVEKDQPLELDALLARVDAERQRLAPLLPEMDPGDLHAILVAVFRPWGSGRRFFLKRVESGVNVF